MSELEIAEKDQLLEAGFTNWNRRDFNTFCRACEKFGRGDIQSIAKEIDGKTEAEVEKYSKVRVPVLLRLVNGGCWYHFSCSSICIICGLKVFWSRYHELSEWERIIKNIEKGEQRIQRQQDIMNAISIKLDRYKNSWLELKVSCWNTPQ